MNPSFALMVIITVLFVLDAYSSYRIWKLGGVEVNPLLSFLNNLSLGQRRQAVIAIKVIILAALWYSQHQGWYSTMTLFFDFKAWEPLAILVGIYLYVVYKNVTGYLDYMDSWDNRPFQDK